MRFDKNLDLARLIRHLSQSNFVSTADIHAELKAYSYSGALNVLKKWHIKKFLNNDEWLSLFDIIDQFNEYDEESLLNSTLQLSRLVSQYELQEILIDRLDQALAQNYISYDEKLSLVALVKLKDINLHEDEIDQIFDEIFGAMEKKDGLYIERGQFPSVTER